MRIYFCYYALQLTGGKKNLLSSNNPKVKYLRRLSNRNFREREGVFLVEGERFVEEALDSSFHLEMMVYSGKARESNRCLDLLERADNINVPCFELEQRLFQELADTVTPQGIMAVVRQCRSKLSDIKKTNNAWLLVIADGVQDPGNLGTIVRSADAAGANGVILLKGTTDIYNQKALRATMGSVFHIPIVQNVTIKEVKEFIQEQGIKLIAGAPREGKAIFDCNLADSCAILVGSEADGPQEETLSEVEEYINIPMPGQAESLNAAVSAGIMLYEVIRQRR